MKCKICGKETRNIFRAKILNKFYINYYHCETCGFLQTEEPFWLEEAYAEPINATDTGYVSRNINLSKKMTILLFLFFDKNGKFLDYAGGYGMFVRLMRDAGFDFYWYDKYTPNLFAKGFEAADTEEYEAVTAFECFEHFVNPVVEIENILSFSGNIIISTELLPEPVPEPEAWWYYGLDHGQHISFYSYRTFRYIANNYGLNYVNHGNLHLLTRKKIQDIYLKVLKLSKFGLHLILQKMLKSKTWEDFERVRSGK